MFNIIFTAWPAVIIGLFDRPVSARTMMANPELYPVFQKKALSNWVSLIMHNANNCILEIRHVDWDFAMALTITLLLIVCHRWK